MKVHGLSAEGIKHLKRPGRYADKDGLYLNISKDGSKSWLYRYQSQGKRRWMGLGGYDSISNSLKIARRKAAEFRVVVNEGRDPLAERAARAEQQRLEGEQLKLAKARSEKTFEVVAGEFLDAKSHEWSNAKHRQQWRNTLSQYVYPILGVKPVAEITHHEVLAVLEPHWSTKNETMTRVRQRIEAIFDFAIAMDYRYEPNPAEWKTRLKPLLPSPAKIQFSKRRHHPALPYDDMPVFFLDLQARDGLASKALVFTILTAARTSEALQAEWAEIDLTNRIWVVPRSRMKAGKEHRVPLSDPVVDLLASLPRVNSYVFPGSKFGRPLSNVAMLNVLRRMGRQDITVHGFRSTFRDWVAEQTHFPARVAETALAHQLKDNAERAYQRGDLIEKRVQLMQAWANYCSCVTTNVVDISRLDIGMA